jgi:YHS domain-containing protein
VEERIAINKAAITFFIEHHFIVQYKDNLRARLLFKEICPGNVSRLIVSAATNHAIWINQFAIQTYFLVMKKLTFALLLVPFLLGAQNENLRRKHYNLEKSLAIGGYDPVSYFEGKPVEGNGDLFLVYKGIKYQFASATSLNKFKADPDKFEPAYGGWCAYAMGATGDRVKIDPETYKIVDGRLYLFYNFWGNNTLLDWNEHESKLKAAADLAWQNTLY